MPSHCTARASCTKSQQCLLLCTALTGWSSYWHAVCSMWGRIGLLGLQSSMRVGELLYYLTHIMLPTNTNIQRHTHPSSLYLFMVYLTTMSAAPLYAIWLLDGIVNNNTSKRDFSTKLSKHVLHHINAHSIHGRPPPCCFCLTFPHSELRAGTDILCGPKDHNRVYKSLTLIPIMSQMNPLHIPTPYLPGIILLLLYLPTNKQAHQMVSAWHVFRPTLVMHLSCIPM